MKQAYSYKGMMKDLSKSKKNPEYYYDAKNIRILATDEETSLSLTGIKGNVLKYTLPTYSYYGVTYQPKLLGAFNVVNYIIVFLYYKSDAHSILSINVDTDATTTLIQGNLKLTETTHIEAESFYENENIIKLYWADGVNPLRYMNILKSPTDIALLDVCPAFIVSQPELEATTWGGVHTSGMIQYCYNLVVKNGAQTRVSPRSELIPLKKQTGGGDVNELVGQINHIKINNVDTKFDIIRVYSVKYTSFNQSPIVSLIAEESISKVNKTTTIRVVDDGNVISNISEKELLFLGGESLVPKSIASKFNYLVLGDIKENYFNVDASVYDTRAYRFKAKGEQYWGTSHIKNSDEAPKDIVINNSGQVVFSSDGSLIPYDHDCINDDVEYREFTTTRQVTNYTPFFSPVTVSQIYEEEPDAGNEGDMNYFVELSNNGTTYEKIRFTYDLALYCPDDNNIVYLNKTTHPEINFTFNYDLTTISDILTEVGNDLNKILKDAQDLNLVNDRYTFILEPREDRPDLGEKLSFKDYLSFVSDKFILTIAAEYITYTTEVTGNSSSEGRYVYAYNSTNYGATGTNVEVTIIPTASTETSFLLKSREKYRIAVEFYNNIGQFTEPKWICDIIIPDGNLDGKVNTLNVTFKNLTALRAAGVVGWNILRVERTEADRTILSQGIVNPCIFQDYDLTVPTDDNVPIESVYDTLGVNKANRVGDYATSKFVKMPSPFMRNASDIVEETITTKSVAGPWPANLIFNAFSGTTGTPKINKIQNGKCISYPIMGGDVAGDIDLGGIDVVNMFSQNPNFPYAEVYKKYVEDKVTAQDTYEFTKMFQFYSPEITFLGPIFGNNLKYTVVGKLDNAAPILNTSGNIIGLEDCSVWGKQISTADDHYSVYDITVPTEPDLSGGIFSDIKNSINTVITTAVEGIKLIFEEKQKIFVKIGDIITDIRLNNRLHLYNTSDKREAAEKYVVNYTDGTGVEYTVNSLHKEGFIGPAGGRSRRQNLYQYYRNYTLDTDYTITHDYREVSGNPTIIGKGEASKIYNDVTLSPDQYTFNNHLFTLISDSNTADPKDTEDPILCVNSVGADCLNIVDSEELALEDILTYYSITGNSTPLVEIKRVLENQYGGNTYEARSRNRYLRVGKYTTLPSTVLTSVTTTIEKAGDIFVDRFKFLRVMPNIAQVQNHRYTAITEIVEFPVESCINNSCRNDYSLDSWDTAWQPSFDQYHNYNRVYSQEAISNVNIATPFTFEPVKHSGVRLLSTKVKTPGEIVDGWTDVLINEELNLNGQYGKLTKLIRNNDTLYFFQDNALGVVMVQPRVAIQASDGIGVELGTGQILYNYQYISTASGSTNPNCIFASPNFVYYIDVTNRTLNRVSDHVEGLSDPAGLHAYMYNNVLQSYDNTYDVVGIYDNINDEAYFTTPGFTIIYNESKNAFTSFYDFKPKHYIKVPGKLYSCNDYINIYQHDVGDYCNFYGVVYDSTVTFFCNPNPIGPVKTRFDNIEFNAEFRDNDIDVFYNENTGVYSLPIKSIEITTDYQKTDDTTLIWGNNIRRKFRNWSIVLPRAYDFTNNKETMDRMRGEWAYIKLTMDNTNNYKLVLHDIILNFA